MIKTFRGLLTDGQQERIRLETIDGKVGYRIKRLDIIPFEPSGLSGFNTIKVFTVRQTAVTDAIDFTEQTLIAVSTISHNSAAFQFPPEMTTVMDQVVFNQDIFVTHSDADGNVTSCNYYLELETVSLDDVEATAVILKNFRNTNTVA